MTRYSHLLSLILLTGALIAHSYSQGTKTNIHVCEGNNATLQCPPGTVIKVDIANFGRWTLKICLNPDDVEDFLSDYRCANPRTLGIMQKKCDGLQECLLQPTNKEFIGDVHPCPHIKVPLYLDVEYSCVLEEPTTTTTTTTTAITTITSTTTVVEDDVVIENETPRGSDKKHNLMCLARTVNGVEYPATLAGLTVTRPCAEGSTGESQWKCSDNGNWLGNNPNTTACISDWIFSKAQHLEDLKEKADGPGIADFLRELAGQTRGTIQAGDMPHLMNFIDKTIVSLTTESWTLGVRQLCNDKMFELVYHLTTNKHDAWSSWPVQKKREMADKLINSMEQVIAWSSGGEKPMTNLYARGHLVAQMSENYKTLKTSRTEYINLPSSRTFEYLDDNVDVPIETLSIGDDKASVYFSAIDSMASNFEPDSVKIISRNKDEEKVVSRTIVSNIVTASIVSKGKIQKVSSMNKPIYITFGHSADLVQHLSNPKCSWWNSEQLKWFENGCKLVSHNNTHTMCSCTHMTHFAVLMDVHGHELSEFDNQLLTFLTYFGCSLSIVCLILTFFCFVLFSKAGGDRIFIHKNLCLMLALAELVFLLGIWRTENKLECSIIAGTLLYLFLSASTWMFIEGYQLYQMLVEVFPKGSKKCLFTFIGYGFPAIVTAGAAVYDSTGFGTKDHCWLKTDNMFILAFVGPAAVIFVLNTVFLVMTLYIVCRHTSGGYLPCRHDSDTGRNVKTWVKGALGISFLLGITWGFGLLWIDDGHSIYMAYAFTISNTLQGLFIFLFHVVFSEKMRKDITRWFARRGCCGIQDPIERKNNIQRAALSPSNGSGSGTGSEFLYPSSEKYHSTPRRLDTSTPYGQQALIQHYQQQCLPPQGAYDYATIQYGDMAPGHVYRSPPNYRTQPRMDYRTYGGTLYRDQIYGANMSGINQVGQYHRPPPEFSPPPPPPQGVPRALYYAARRPPSSKMSDDSVYSEGGSSMLATEVTPTGATVLRMDLSKNPPVYCQDL